jgi:hypothetical protein
LASQDAAIAQNTSDIATNAAGIGSLKTAVNTTGVHVWYGSGSVACAANALASAQCTNYTTDRSAGIATITGGNLLLNKPGNWYVAFVVDSDCGFAGLAGIGMQWTGGDWGANQTTLRDRRPRLAGVPGGGALSQPVSWSGPVDAASAAAPISLFVSWLSATASTATVSYWLYANYLGGPAS